MIIIFQYFCVQYETWKNDIRMLSADEYMIYNKIVEIIDPVHDPAPVREGGGML